MPWSDQPPAVGELAIDLLDAMRDRGALTCRELAALTARKPQSVARSLAILREARLVGCLQPRRRHPLHRPPYRWRLVERGRLELERRLVLGTSDGPRRAVYGHVTSGDWARAWGRAANLVCGHMRRVRGNGWELHPGPGPGVCRVTFAT